MQIVCCECRKEYDAKFYKAEGISVPIFECPHCGLQHIIEITPFRTDCKKQEIERIDLTTDYWVNLYKSRILSIDGTTDHSGSDDNPVTDWTKTTEFIVACGLTTLSKDTTASTYKLQWQDDASPGYVDLDSDAGSPKLSYTITDNSWAHGAAVATADQKVTLDPGESTRVDGERIKNQSASDSLDQGDEEGSELWFGVNSDNAEDGHTYSFQLYCIAEGAANGICLATITIAAAPSDLEINVSDGIGVGEALTPINPYDKFSISDLIGIAESIVASLSPSARSISVNDAIGIIESIVLKVSGLRTEPFDNVAIQEAITAKVSDLNRSVQDLVGVQESIAAKISSLTRSVQDQIAIQEAIDAVMSNPDISLSDKIGILESVEVTISSGEVDLEISVQDLIAAIENIAIKVSGLKGAIQDRIAVAENVSTDLGPTYLDFSIDDKIAIAESVVANLSPTYLDFSIDDKIAIIENAITKISSLKGSVHDQIAVQESVDAIISNPKMSVFDKIGILEDITVVLSSIGEDLEINLQDLIGIIEGISVGIGPAYLDHSIYDQVLIGEHIKSKMSSLNNDVHDLIGVQEWIDIKIYGVGSPTVIKRELLGIYP